MAVLQQIVDTIDAFGDQTSGWYDKFWVAVVMLVIGVVALVLALLATFERADRLSAFSMALAGAIFFDAALNVYFRLVVLHFGYDVPL